MAEKKDKKTKRPTAEKRMLQNEKARKRNRERKSKIRTAIRRFEEAVTLADAAKVKESLGTAFSTIDKGVKGGVLNINKAARMKARLTAKARTV